MVFSSQVFVFIFLPLVFIVNTAVMAAGKGRKGFVKASNRLLLISSLIFYSWGEPLAVLLLVFEALFCFAMALLIGKKPRLRKLWVALCCVLVLGVLCFFKYTGFLAGLIGAAAGVPAIGDTFKSLALPLGISFFSFQLLSYVIDVYRGTTEPCRNYFRMLLYTSFFPQLVAGPIVKYKDIAAQFEDRRFDPVGAAKGARRFVTGLAKKLLIANTVALLADAVFDAAPETVTGGAAILGAVCYMLQIYFDFSGYSDMAIGMGRMFGFTINENFKHPYASLSVREFWRRWHISLSSWFRDYLYIPLGGNRKGRFRTVLNKLTVFFLTGLWHGAGFTFILWGLWHGLLLLIEEYAGAAFGAVRSRVKSKKGKDRADAPADPFLKAIAGFFRLVYVLAAVLLGFVMFRSDSVAHGFTIIGRMFSNTWELPAAVQVNLTPFMIFAMAAGVLASMPWAEWAGKLSEKDRFKGIADFFAKEKVKTAVLAVSMVLTLALFAACVLSLASSAYNPFIYFRF
ncbi:MAG: MBOAT family protein [Clostridia bacterium]|nr:MBOAT family protein [Clostridia bacterium]